MFDLDYDTIKMIILIGLLFAVFALSDLVAVIIIATTLTGFALIRLRKPTPDPQEQRWRRGPGWWR